MTAALHSTFQAVRGAILTGIGHGKSHTKPIRELQQNLSGKNTETTKVFVCSTLVAGGSARYTVLIEGQYYVVNKYMLADLRAGHSPEQLGLEPEETGEDVDV